MVYHKVVAVSGNYRRYSRAPTQDNKCNRCNLGLPSNKLWYHQLRFKCEWAIAIFSLIQSLSDRIFKMSFSILKLLANSSKHHLMEMCYLWANLTKKERWSTTRQANMSKNYPWTGRSWWKKFIRSATVTFSRKSSERRVLTSGLQIWR